MFSYLAASHNLVPLSCSTTAMLPTGEAERSGTCDLTSRAWQSEPGSCARMRAAWWGSAEQKLKLICFYFIQLQLWITKHHAAVAYMRPIKRGLIHQQEFRQDSRLCPCISLLGPEFDTSDASWFVVRNQGGISTSRFQFKVYRFRIRFLYWSFCVLTPGGSVGLRFGPFLCFPPD